MSRWQTVPLGEILDVDRDMVQVNPTEKYRTAGLYSHGRGLFWRPEVNGAGTSYRAYARLKEGQFVFSRLFAWEGALSIVPTEFDGAFVSSEFPSFSVDKESVDPSFLGYFVRRADFYRSLSVNGMGNRRQRVNTASVLRSPFPLPPLPEQRAMVRWLASLEERLVGSKKLREKASLLDVAARESMVSEASVGSAVSRLGDEFIDKRCELVVESRLDYRTIGIKSFGKGIIRYPAVPGSELSKLRFFRFPTKALAVSNIQAWEGALAMTGPEDEGRIASNRFHFYTPRAGGKIDPRFALAYLLSERGHAEVRAASPGTTMRNKTLSLQRFEDILLPNPGPEVQQRIIKALHILDLLDRARALQQVKANAVLPAALNRVFGSLNWLIRNEGVIGV